MTRDVTELITKLPLTTKVITAVYIYCAVAVRHPNTTDFTPCVGRRFQGSPQACPPRVTPKVVLWFPFTTDGIALESNPLLLRSHPLTNVEVQVGLRGSNVYYFGLVGLCL